MLYRSIELRKHLLYELFFINHVSFKIFGKFIFRLPEYKLESKDKEEEE